MCTENSIKELLPSYIERTLDQDICNLVDNHLATCEDCGKDLALLTLMMGGPVPDPGEAFWQTMPERMYRAVRDQQASTRPSLVPWLMEHLTLPRWTWAAAAAAIVLVTWFVIPPVQRTGSVDGLREDEYAFEDILMSGTLNMAELTQSELDLATTWASGEIALIEREAGDVLAISTETDIVEELAELDTHDLERLSRMIGSLKQEG